MNELDDRISELQAELKAKQMQWHRERRKVGITTQERIQWVDAIRILMDRIEYLRRRRDEITEPPFI